MKFRNIVFAVLFLILPLRFVFSQNTSYYGNLNGNSVLGGLGSSGNYALIPFDTVFNSTANGSIEMWIKPVNLSHENTLISKGNSASNLSFSLNLSQSSGLEFQIGSVVFAPPALINIPLNQWSHVAVTWSGGQSAYIIKYYVNGLLSGTVGPLASVWDTGSNPLVIGGSFSSPQKYFEGKIDEVRFWRVEKTAFHIAINRFTGVGDEAGTNSNNELTSGFFYSGLISSWSFNSPVAVFDYIGGKHGTYVGGAQSQSALSGQPIPYNECLKVSGLSNDWVTIQDNPVFNLSTKGTIETWINLSSLGGIAPIFIKGNSYANTTLGFFLTPANKVGINIGAHNFIDSGPLSLEQNKWYHIAATWSGGPDFNVKIYINGIFQSALSFSIPMPVNNEPAWIGRNYTTSRINCYLDELRIWKTDRTSDDIRKTMFVSGTALKSNPDFIAGWNFEGNLKNTSMTTGIDGTFNNGAVNNSRFSAYFNEGFTGAPGKSFISFNTALNGEDFQNFNFSVNKKICSDPGITTDTIVISNIPGNVNNLQLFLNLEHPRTGDVSLTLTAPNGQSRTFSQNIGDSSLNGFFTIFDDNFSESITSENFQSPWSNYVKPQNVFGTMGGSQANGNWILKIDDANAANQGVLRGWGLRVNYTVGINNNTEDLPVSYSLQQNYPNPFNPFTTIEFNLPKAGNVSVKIYDLAGREYTSDIRNLNLNPGNYKMNFNGSELSSGVYFYSLNVNGQNVATKKMLMIK